jgi:hypothetical protein
MSAMSFPSLAAFAAPAPVSNAPQGAQADPTKGSKDIDKVIEYAPDKVLQAAREAFLVYGCDIDAKKDKPDYVECKRANKMGVFVGSGGEKLSVRVSAKGTSTRVEVKTSKTFVGIAGQKNWSTPVFDEMLKILKGGLE